MNEIKVGFTLTDFECTPEEITTRIRLEPSKTWVVGDQISGSTLAYKVNGWRLELIDEDASGVEALLEQLLQQLEVSGHAIAELAREYYAEISCIVFATEYVPELHFSHKALERITRLGAGIDIDLYCLTSDETDVSPEKNDSASGS